MSPINTASGRAREAFSPMTAATSTCCVVSAHVKPPADHRSPVGSCCGWYLNARKNSRAAVIEFAQFGGTLHRTESRHTQRLLGAQQTALGCSAGRGAGDPAVHRPRPHLVLRAHKGNLVLRRLVQPLHPAVQPHGPYLEQRVSGSRARRPRFPPARRLIRTLADATLFALADRVVY